MTFQPNKGLWLASVASLALAAVATPALAQQTSDSQSAEDNRGLDEIVVTAQRREQNVQDVPISVSVVAGDAVTNSGYKGLQDIQFLAPGVQFDPNFGSGFQVRGVGTQVFDYSTEQAVGVVVDEVVYDLPRIPGIQGLVDIDRIEVLRGPQGTLFGKNSSAGVISVTTKKPSTTETEGEFSVAYGERNDRRLAAAINTPLGSNAALRVTGFYQGQDGFARNRFLNIRIGDVRDYGIRGKLLVQPSEDIEILLTADIAKHRDNQLGVGSTRSYVGIDAPTAARVAAGLATFGIVAGPNTVDVAHPIEAGTEYTQGGASLVVNANLGSSTLTSITAYREGNILGTNPLDTEPTVNFLQYNQAVIKPKKFSQEVRLASGKSDSLEYVLGLYYGNFKLFSTQEQAGTFGTVGALPPGTFFSPTNGLAVFGNKIESFAGFANVTAKFGDQFALTLGGRLTHDKSLSTFANSAVTLAYNYIPVSGVPAPFGRTKQTNFSYRITPTFKVNDDVLVYATHSTGYKGPGIAYVSAVQQPYTDETVKSFELGVKSELFDRRLRLNIAAFSQKYKDFQAQSLGQNASGGFFFAIINAGGLRTRGVEMEFNAKASQSLSFNGGVTYSDSVFTDYVKNGVQVAGNELSNAPKWSWTLNAALDQPVSDSLSVIGNIGASYRSSVYQNVDPVASPLRPTSFQKGYAIVNGRLGLGGEDGKWQVGVSVRNLFDQRYTSQTVALPTGVVRIDPLDSRRTFGIFAETKF